MAENKTQPTASSVEAFLDGITSAQRRDDAKALCAIMSRLSGAPPVMWGSAIVGFGRYRYAYDSGRTGEFLRIGFAARSNALVLYLIGGFPQHDALLARLGKYSTGKSCLYLKKLSDADPAVLEELIAAAWAHMADKYPVA
jgi:hypothetical protein